MQIHPLIYPLSTSCNLSCSYCFHRNKTQDDFKKKMSVDVFKKFLDEWLKITSLNGNCEIIWHGGEPLLRGLDFYKRTTKLVQQKSSSKRIVKQSIQTNGTLLNDQWIIFFKKNDFSVGLSFDGPVEVHNLFRKNSLGEGSFKKVDTALSLCHKHNLFVGEVAVIHKGNVNKAREMFDFFKKKKMKKIQLSPCLEVDSYKKDSFSIQPEEFGLFICELYDLWLEEDNPDISIGYIDDIIGSFLGEDCYNCFLSDRCHNFISVDWNGDIMSCENLFGKKFIFGNIMENSLVQILKNPERISLYKKISQRRKDVCGKCQWFSVCKGGCPYQWKSLKIGKTALCKANKIIFEHIGNSIHQIYTQ